MKTREEVSDMAERAIALARMCHIVFHDEEPASVGAALAEAMATFLCGHRIVGGAPAQEHALREAVLEDWLKTLHEIVEARESASGGMR